MKAIDIFKLATALISQEVNDSEDLKKFTPAWLTILLEESLETENSIRRAKGINELEAAPIIKDGLGDEVPYQSGICKTALPYGLAAYFYQDDDNDYRQADYRARFINALSELEKSQLENIRDVYQDAENE